jgi:hypothetical protein
MAKVLETLGFVMLIGGQFSSVILVISKRTVPYPGALQPSMDQHQPTEADEPVAMKYAK